MVYAAVSAVAAALLYGRHLQELRYPAEASGGMWAAGDAMLWIFIICLFIVPTVFLVWIIAKFETIYKTYSQLLLGLSLTAPVCLSSLYLGGNYLTDGVKNLCLDRLFWSPLMLSGIGVSRLAARFDRAKKLVSYALLIEGLTFAAAVALFIHAWGGPGAVDRRGPTAHERVGL
jgi:hypothetical protein